MATLIDEFMVLVGNSLLTRRHKLGGQVFVDGSPAKRLVLVMDRYNHARVASTWSDQVTGQWSITNLPEFPERGLLVVALDTTGMYNAEVADYVSQVATP